MPLPPPPPRTVGAPWPDAAAETAVLQPVAGAVRTAAPLHAPAPGSAPRGRILVVEGGFAASGRWPWSRQAVSAGAPALSAVLAAVSPQVLLAADAVDAVHLPSATDPQTVLAHLRSAARHPGPVLVHLAGHVLADRRGGRLHLALRDTRPATVRHDGLPWQWIAAELRTRPAEWGALVIADLSADEAVWPMLHTVPSPLAEGLPLWAAVNPDPQQVGTFTRALVEALHSGQPGAGAALSPEQLQHQVQSVLRPDVLVVASHGPGRPVFRNTARRTEPAPQAPHDGAAAAAPVPAPAPRAATTTVSGTAAVPAAVAAVAGPPAGPRPAVLLDKPGASHPAAASHPVAPGAPASRPAAAAPVTLDKPGPPPPARPPAVRLGKAAAPAAPAGPPPAAVPQTAPAPAEDPAAALAEYREPIGRIVRAADAGEHATAADLAATLERQAVAMHGDAAPAALHVRQVRAHVSRLAGRQALAADLYRDVALKLLAVRGPEHPETLQAASNADACWRAVHDVAEARRIAPAMIALRGRVPGPDGRKLRAAERYLAQLGEMRPDA
ncbi:hypothetical protein [Streptomyces sp. NPDC001380]|uniref:hypothetical protein n=1 Tax=Streptomyces sp. NPDC001380 TaxID=3364566 RepID=UPI003694FF05